MIKHSKPSKSRPIHGQGVYHRQVGEGEGKENMGLFEPDPAFLAQVLSRQLCGHYAGWMTYEPHSFFQGQTALHRRILVIKRSPTHKLPGKAVYWVRLLGDTNTYVSEAQRVKITLRSLDPYMWGTRSSRPSDAMVHAALTAFFQQPQNLEPPLSLEEENTMPTLWDKSSMNPPSASSVVVGQDTNPLTTLFSWPTLAHMDSAAAPVKPSTEALASTTTTATPQAPPLSYLKALMSVGLHPLPIGSRMNNTQPLVFIVS